MKSNCAARLSRKKAIIVSAALLTFFIVGLTPNGIAFMKKDVFSSVLWSFCLVTTHGGGVFCL
jgi:hypothetical protein